MIEMHDIWPSLPKGRERDLDDLSNVFQSDLL